MTQYLNDTFSLQLASKKYRDNWDKVFGDPEEETPADPITKPDFPHRMWWRIRRGEVNCSRGLRDRAQQILRDYERDRNRWMRLEIKRRSELPNPVLAAFISASHTEDTSPPPAQPSECSHSS